MSKKKNKIIEQANEFVAIMDAKTQNPQTAKEKLIAAVWKATGMIFVPMPCLFLLGAILIAIVVALIFRTAFLNGLVAGMMIANIMVIILASIDHYRELAETRQKK